jgi:hypothetical protein
MDEKDRFFFESLLAKQAEQSDRRMENLAKKIDSVAVDLSAHRSDTEAHHGVYRVKES